jgi:trimeric autotransporter adhesin
MKKVFAFLIFAFGPSFFICSQNYIISTIAGNGTWAYSGDGGPATNAELDYPPGVAADGLGNVYIADYVNYRIRKVNSSGIISTFAGNGIHGNSGDGGPATSAEIYNPWTVTTDKFGNVYFSDVGTAVIRKINTSGIISLMAGGGSGGDIM